MHIYSCSLLRVFLGVFRIAMRYATEVIQIVLVRYSLFYGVSFLSVRGKNSLCGSRRSDRYLPQIRQPSTSFATCTNNRASSGSNCVPAFRMISSIAVSIGSALR